MILIINFEINNFFFNLFIFNFKINFFYLIGLFDFYLLVKK
jgi:hypothetical protein